MLIVVISKGPLLVIEIAVCEVEEVEYVGGLSFFLAKHDGTQC